MLFAFQDLEKGLLKLQLSQSLNCCEIYVAFPLSRSGIFVSEVLQEAKTS
jgi:hypothetical protein